MKKNNKRGKENRAIRKWRKAHYAYNNSMQIMTVFSKRGKAVCNRIWTDLPF